ncbi:MAG: putative transcriptional regulator [Geminicoccaceae bacterium]|nr:putative transcriptional regulator [Geminicoccaceae bacterium]
MVDRAPRITLGRAAFVGTLLGAAALRIPIALDLPAVSYAVLASAHLYEIVLDIVFWVVVAAFLDVIELKRGTPLIYMALAAGGVLGGALTSALAPLMPAEDLLLALPILAAIAAAQFGLARRRLEELPDPQRTEADMPGPVDSLRLLPRLVARYPLILLIALNALMLTVLYGLCEYLVFTIYAERYQDEAALTRFLALMFAGIQVLELGLLYVLGRPLLERAGPLARNLVFPITSLACLIGFAFGQKLPAAIATHLNAEAISNAIFQPVNNANYAALPLRYQGRVRTLADGVFYPAGLALAGVMLLSLQDRLALAEVTFIAIVFALVFLLLNVGVGALFLPTLLRNLRSGVVHVADLAPDARTPPALLAERIGELLRSADPEARALGLDLAQHLDPAPLLPELRQLAPSADRSSRRSLVRLLARAPAPQLGPLLDELLEGDAAPGQLVALQVKLARRERIAAQQAQRLVASPCCSVAALAVLAHAPPAATPVAEILRWCADAETAADVIDACAPCGRADLAALLIAVIETAPAEQQRQGLAVLAGLGAGEPAGAAALARSLMGHADPHLRAEAAGVLGAVAETRSDHAALAEALGDRSRLVRQRAVQALAAKGDQATPLAAARLTATDPGVVEAAVRTLGRIGSRRAVAALSTLLEPARRDGIRNLAWLRRLPHGPEHREWLALELALEDHNRRIVDLVLNVATALAGDRSIGDLRHALGAGDQRTRAQALEALLASPQRRLIQPILPLLEALHAPLTREREAAAGSARILATAIQVSDPWVRSGAIHTARALRAGAEPGGRRAPAAPCQARSPAAGSPPLTATELAMDQVLLLKRVALFRYLPLDTLLAVSQVLERRPYLPGETVLEPGTRWDHFCIVESGAVDLFAAGGTVEHLTAPAHFGELILADEPMPAPRVVAAGEGVLLRLHRIVFQDLSRDHPDMLMELCKLLARRLRQHHGAMPAAL